MLTPSLFLRQVSDLSADRRRLDIPAERPKPTAPAHLFEKDPPPPAPVQQQPAAKKAPPPNLNPPVPTAAMHAMSLGPNAQKTPSGTPPASSKPQKEKKEKEKKRLHFFR
ncbi:syntaxin binding protein 1 [Aspergillus fumigatus]